MPLTYPGTGGTGGRQTFNAGTFSDLPALNTWGSSNLNSLFNSDTQVTVASIDDVVYEWSGTNTPSTYPSGGSWTIRSQPTTTDLSGVGEGKAVFNINGQAASGPIRRLSDGNAFIQGITEIESGTLQMGPFINISEQGGFIGPTNVLGDKFTFVDYRSPRNAASSKPRRLAPNEAENDFVVQSDSTQTLSFPVNFMYTTTLDSRVNAFKMDVGSDITNMRMRIADTNDPSVVFKYWPSRAAWIDGTGQNISAGTDIMLDLGDSPLAFFAGRDLTIDIQADSGALLGNGSGVPKITAVIQRLEIIESADLSEVPSTVSNSINAGELVTTISSPDGTQFSSNAVTLPSGDDNYVDTSTIEIGTDNTISLTLGRTGSLNDLGASFRLIAGSGITLTPDTVNDTITINAISGGSTPVTTDLRYGLSNQSDPALVDFTSLTDVPNPTDPQTVSTGITSVGQYFHVFSANTHDIQTITDTVLQQIVYQDGGTGNIFTKTSDAMTVNSTTYDAYSIGPLNAGVNEQYVLRFS